MGSSQDLWVTVANVALGLVVGLLLLAAFSSVIIEIVTHFTRRHALRAELDRGLRDLALHSRSHR